MRRVLALMLVGGICLSGCSFTGDDAQGANRKKATRPNVVLVVFDEFGGDILLGPNGKIDAGRFPALRLAGPRRHLVPQRTDALRLDHQGGAADPRRDGAAAGDRADRA